MANFTLTSGADTVVGGPADDTVYATAATLNVGDSLTGGAGTDVLALAGSGTFRIDQLATFTGFERVTLDNATNSFAQLTLGNQPIEVDATGLLQIVVNSPSNWNGSDVINGDATSSTEIGFYNNQGVYPPPQVTYDLTSNTFSHTNVFDGSGDNVTLLINNTDTAGVQSFYANGQGNKLVTAGSTLDLSHTTVSGFTVSSANALGTTFTVGDLGTALQIAGGSGQDTLIAQGFTFSADQRNSIFASSSIETITDQTGTYTASAPSPGVVGLTNGNDTFVAPSSGSTVYATAATLNAGDSLTGGAGTDVLALAGSGTFRIDQLATFTGFERVTLDNATNSFAQLTLGNQPIEVDATGLLQIVVNSPSNWNGSDVINGDATSSTEIGFYNNQGVYPPPQVTYDLTSNTFSHTNVFDGSGDNVTLLINNTDTAGVQSFYANGQGNKLVTAGSTLDLSHTTVSGFTVSSANALGTTFTVGDLGTALQIAGGSGQDTIVAAGFTFSADQRNSIFASSSIERIVDQRGTYTVGNTAPTIVGTLSSQTTTSEAAVKPFAGVTIGDANFGATDTLTITLGGAGGTLADGTGFSSLTKVGAGVYRLSGTAAAITSELDALVFTPKAGPPNASWTTTFTLSEQSSANGAPTVESTTSVVDIDPAVAPTIAGTVSGLTTTSEASVNPFAGVTIGDANNGGGNSNTLSIAFAAADGFLSGAGLVGSNGNYSLTGTAAAITSELRALVFTPVDGVPNTSVTTIFALSDTDTITGTTSGSNSATTVIDSDPAVAPTIAGTVAGQTTTSEASVNPFAGVTIGDANNGGGNSNTLSIAFAAADGFLSGAGLVGSNGNYSLTGTAAAITSELRALVFRPVDGVPNTSVTTIFALSDTDTITGTTSGSNSATTVIDSDPAVAPTIAGTVAGQTTTSEASVNPFAGVTIGDANNGGGNSNTLSIAFTAADGFLSGAGLVGSNGNYSLTGTAAAITSELRALVFTPVDGVPNTSVTTIFALSDTDTITGTTSGSNSATTVIDSDPAVAPTIAGTVAGQTTTSETPVRPFAHATVSDANVGATDTLTITLGGGGGVLSGTGVIGGVGGVYTLSGTAAGINSELDALVFTPKAGAPYTSSTTTFTLSDQSSAGGGPAIDTTTTVIDKDFAPPPPVIHPNNRPVEPNNLALSGSVTGAHDFMDTLNFVAGYGDLINAFGTNQQAAQNWYNKQEPIEQRVETFDGLDYVASYSDLINAFKSAGSKQAVLDAGATHFINSGYHEGRTTTFNGLDYIASYGDLINALGANGDAGAYHYIENGASEGRTTTFDGLDYIASYSDLINALGANEQAGAEHFIDNGYKEGRTTTFNGLDYIASYGDLIQAYGANNDAGATHYIDYGAKEGRTTTFDGLDYIASYGDLIKALGANEQAGAEHFIDNGYKEGRTTTFDGLDYIANYTDLMKAYGANNDAGATHYIDYGSSEHRSTSFNVGAYESAHPDLIGKYASNDAFLTAYINTYKAAGTFLT